MILRRLKNGEWIPVGAEIAKYGTAAGLSALAISGPPPEIPTLSAADPEGPHSIPESGQDRTPAEPVVDQRAGNGGTATAVAPGAVRIDSTGGTVVSVPRDIYYGGSL